MPKQAKNKQLLIHSTGEIVEDKESAMKASKELRKQKKQVEQELKETLAKIEFDENNITEMFDGKKDKITSYDKSYFYKLKKNPINNEAIYSLSHSARELFFLLMINMDYMDNVVTINRMYPSNEELQKLFNMSKPTFQKALKELSEKGMVTLERKRIYRIITLNPYFIEDTKTTESVWLKFKNWLTR
jgi:DNA-binding transcriptional ArsR family regulator